MNKAKYIKTPYGEFKTRTNVGYTYFTYENNENSFFDFSREFPTNASTLRVEATIIEK